MTWWITNLVDLYRESGATDSSKILEKKEKKIKPKCALCHKFIGYSTGAHIFFTEEVRLHISCFAEKIDILIESGVIDKIREKESNIWYQY